MSYEVVLTRVLMSIVLGGVIGTERQMKHRPAGFRTYVLVCLGSSIVVMVSEFSFIKYYNEYGFMSDPLRLGAQVISGIGFLGAGTIIHYGSNVKGLTTAASLWVVACIGLAIGIGFYSLAITATVAVICIVYFYSALMSHMKFGVSNVRHDLLVTLKNKPKIIGNISLVLSEYDVEIVNMEFSKDTEIELLDSMITTKVDADMVNLKFILKLKNINDITNITSDILNIEGVESVQDL